MGSSLEPLAAIAAAVGADVSGPASADVDRSARFPHESVAAFRDAGLLSAMVPQELGGRGARPSEVAAAVREIAAHCASSALVLAMHSMEVSNLARHGTTEPLRELQREIVREQPLIANANSEVGTGGDVSQSICAIEDVNGRPTLTKEALAISYGEHADLVVATARRTPESEAGDQVQVICRAPSLEPRGEWNALGLRGTGSRPFLLRAELDPDLIYPVPFRLIGSSGGLHTQLLFLSAVWVGLADRAAETAHRFVRAAARKQIGTTPPSALRLSELVTPLSQSRALLETVARQVDATDGADAEDPALLSALRTLKVGCSEAGVAVATAALEICGIAGYREDSEFSVERILRDALGGLVMVSNDRYVRVNAQMLTARKRI